MRKPAEYSGPMPGPPEREGREAPQGGDGGDGGLLGGVENRVEVVRGEKVVSHGYLHISVFKR